MHTNEPFTTQQTSSPVSVDGLRRLSQRISLKNIKTVSARSVNRWVSTFLTAYLTLGMLNAQSVFPDFLIGTWKIDNTEVYEHWDQVSNESYKGLSYRIQDGLVIPTEYLEMVRDDDEVIYLATVPHQNAGQTIRFSQTQVGDRVVFENPDHDFPRIVTYEKISPSKIQVELSDGEDKQVSYELIRVEPVTRVEDTTTTNPNYDPVLAEQLGADDYGMKSYILVLLKSGSNPGTDPDLVQSSFRGHMANIGRLVDEGKLVVAGPLGKNENSYRGIFILNVSTIEEAEELLQSDPAIEAGLLDADLYPWYGSAALSQYLDASDKIWKKQP